MEVFFSGFLNFFPKPGQTVQGQEEDVVGAHVQMEEPLLVEGPEAV